MWLADLHDQVTLHLNAELEEQFSTFSPSEVDVVVLQENEAVGAVAASRFKPRAVLPVLR